MQPAPFIEEVLSQPIEITFYRLTTKFADKWKNEVNLKDYKESMDKFIPDTPQEVLDYLKPILDKENKTEMEKHFVWYIVAWSVVYSSVADE